MSFLLLTCLLLAVNNAYWPPEQIHISLPGTPDQMNFNWLTWDYPIVTTSYVLLGKSSHPSSFTMNISGKAYEFTDAGSEHINRTIHLVKVNDLEPSTKYYYQVGCATYGYSTVYHFTTAPDASTLAATLPHNFIIYGDMGTTNTQACGPATEMVFDDDINAVIHVGDVAYNMNELNGTRGDEFMADITPMATMVPYQIVEGNHESASNFSEYTHRFRGQPLPMKPAPQTVWTGTGELPNNWYYSFNYGLVHYVAISSEIYFDFPWMIQGQYEWLENDLKIANTNRSNAPWVIVYHHRPLYGSCTGSECGSQTVTMRNGVIVNGTFMYGLEDVFYKYGVDISFCGHAHNYERSYDVYKNKTDKKTTDMTATVYIVDGDAGNREGHHAFNAVQPEWSAYRSLSYSFSKFVVYNATHVNLQQIVSDSELPPDQQGKVMDDTWFIQHNHGPFKAVISDSNDIDTNAKSVTWDPYTQYGIPMKVAQSEYDDPIPYISNDKQDYEGIHGVHF